jgi:hypothetical protein
MDSTTCTIQYSVSYHDNNRTCKIFRVDLTSLLAVVQYSDSESEVHNPSPWCIHVYRDDVLVVVVVQLEVGVNGHWQTRRDSPADSEVTPAVSSST